MAPSDRRVFGGKLINAQRGNITSYDSVLACFVKKKKKKLKIKQNLSFFVFLRVL